VNPSTDNSCQSPDLPRCPHCDQPSRVLVAASKVTDRSFLVWTESSWLSVAVCPQCSGFDGPSHALADKLKARLATAPTLEMNGRRRRRPLSEAQKNDMIANLNRLLQEVGHA